MAFNPADIDTTNAPTHYFSVTPSDTVDFDRPIRAVFVGVAGDVAFVSVHGEVVTYTLEVGRTVICAQRINATNTTATGIIGEY